jgi:hypothetical protein
VGAIHSQIGGPKGFFMETEGGDSRDASGSTGGKSGDASTSGAGDYARELGVIEAIMAVTRSCPSGVVVSAAESALEAIKTGGAGVMKQQAYFVLVALQGWRGDRARQVHRSLTNYLESGHDSEHPDDTATEDNP